MSIVNDVEACLAKLEDLDKREPTDAALRKAEELADLYNDIRPNPYVVPIERFAGLPIATKAN